MVWVCALLILSVAALLTTLDLRQAWFEQGHAIYVAAKLFLYWSSWLLLPALLYLAAQAYIAIINKNCRLASCVLLAFATLSCFAWGRFVEPRVLRVRATAISSVCQQRIALISDIHAGLFVRESTLERLVDKLNALHVDAVLVAGDWTYEPTRDLDAYFSPFKQLHHPIYAVLGNHDESYPGPQLNTALRASLSRNGVRVIEGARVPLGGCEVIGLADHSADIDAEKLKEVSLPNDAGLPTVVLTHNPDVAALLAPRQAQLVLAGHTHGGQIRLPFLTDIVLRAFTRGAYDHGIYKLAHTRLFVTSGIGMVGLPFRFAVPPTIDILEL